jgi:hypothetical protein
MHLPADKKIIGCIGGYLSLDYLKELVTKLVIRQFFKEVPDVCNRLYKSKW